jgi:tRNA threonylcarbamoyladenosine biosynthesis protein TsaE
LSTYYSQSAEETIGLGRRIGAKLKAGAIVSMDGVLAAGKTTMTKGIAEALSVEDTVTSPTFTIISEYTGTLPLYHIDAYRLDSLEDFRNIGAEELLYGQGVCVIEWGEKVEAMLSQDRDVIHIRIQVEEDGSRIITVDGLEL